MSNVRGSTLSIRMRALQKLQLRPDGTRGRTDRKVGTVMAEQLELAAIYAVDGAGSSAASVAILAALGIDPTGERRAAIEADIDIIRRCVQSAINRHGAH